MFNAHPDAFEQHFKHMAGMSNNLKITGVGRAHTMAVFNGIGAFVDCIDDDECMDGLAKKLARNHFERGVNHVRFGVGAAVLLLLLSVISRINVWSLLIFTVCEQKGCG